MRIAFPVDRLKPPGLSWWECHLLPNHLELYNLRKDISEKHNLAAAEPEKLREMANTLTEFLRSATAPMPTDNTTEKTVEYPVEIGQ